MLQDGCGVTALWNAVLCEWVRVAELLLLSGADATVEDEDGTQLTQIASEQMRALLRTHSNSNNSNNNDNSNSAASAGAVGEVS